ncbi:hypothetical protein PYW08_008973 [Mythimna loreyi]|uniref:Uncharacterized protein n=1 Tax=Mythimna loreyi TaxID=667449 RepID=A0ACC2Q942_9NEOP|nr:hypothetical protein PYW08_008973 [Mythimna loreyi]
MSEPNSGDGDVSSADVTVSKNPNGLVSPLSEVGLTPTPARPSDLNNGNSSSASVNGVPTEFFTQMLQMMKHMSDRITIQPDTPKVKINEVFLPSYDPDTNVGVREWCQHVTTAMETYGLSDYEVRMKVGSLLKGRARLWVDNWLVSTTTWQELRDVLITTFEPENRYSRDIVRFREHNYDNSKDIAQFLSQAWVLWRRVTRDKLSNDDAVEAVIGCIGDERLRIELLNARATSVPELISVASSIRSVKRPQPGTSGAHSGPAKRPRFDKPSLFCQICKKPGHDARDCRYRDKNDNSQPRQQDNKTASQNNKPTCTFCSRIGHTYDTCYKRERAVVSSVNCVGTSKLNSMSVVVGNLNLHAIFDSGAECSVIRESVAAKLPGKRVDRVSYLKGLGQFTVISLSTLTTICVIDSLRIELEFHVVPDYEVCSDILIGMNLVEKNNLSVLVNSRGATLVHQPVVYHVRSQNEKFDNLDCDLTNDDQINELKILLNKFQHLFIHGYPRTRVNTGELEIRLKDDNKWVERRPYRLSPVEREKVREIVKELLEHKIIRESKSPFSSPIILVKKKNGMDRMCVDYRELNRNTLRDHYPLPIISDQIDQLAGGYYFSTLDMAAGFHQIPISEASIEKTAFVTPDGLYEFLTMPFGLSNAVSVYQRCINRALAHLLTSVDQVCQVYVDDVLSKCRDFAEGIAHIERILIALQEAGFSINVDKTAFFKRSIEYLGNIIADGQVSPSPRKVEALTKAPIPKTVKQVRQFNGLAGYFRRFIPNFSRVMVPLYELTKNDAKWEWNERHDEARNHIIRHLSTAPTLTLFQEDAPIELYTDASSIGYGAVLVQTIGGRQHPVAYMSQRTTDAESRYHSYELETLAVVRAIKHFRHYIYGRKFKVITDCNALKASKNKKDLLPRIHRWWAFLQNYEFEVEYRKGERLQHADFFSRNPSTEISVNFMTRDTEWLQIEQRRDDVLRPLINTMSGGSPAEGYVLEEGVLKKTLTDSILGIHKPIVVPRSFQWSLINSFHVALQHPGWEKTLQKLRETYWFHKMSTIVRRFVDNCVVCRTSKGPSGAIQAQLHPIQKPTAAFQVVHMDITGKLGTKNADGRDEYVIVTIDAYTKYILLSYSNDKSPSSSLAALKRVVHLFGTPVQVVVDGGREFLGEFKVYSDRFGIDIHSIAPGVSRANGQVERIMGTLKNALTMIRNYDTEEWQTALEALQLAFNCTPHRVTGVAPLTLLTRRQHSVPPELLKLVNINNECIDFDLLEQHVQEKITAAGQYDKQRFDRGKAKMRPFQRGDYVLVKNNPRNQTSLDLKYSEPYEVYRILDNDRYIVKRVNGRGRPRKVAHDQLRRAPQPGEQETVSTNSEDDPQQVAVRLADDSSTNLVEHTLQQRTSENISTPPLEESQPSTSQVAQMLDL